jgi:Holliday junction resolvase RusA-like endonuclease
VSDIEVYIHMYCADVDNLVKFVLDSLNRVAYEDDGQVAVLSAAKLYTAGQSRVEVHMRRLGDADGLFAENFVPPSPRS